MNPIGDEHFERLSRLLDFEAEAEREQAAQAQTEGEGRALTGMAIREEDAGLGGRILLTFGKRDVALLLPPTRLQPGSPVLLKCHNGGDPLAIRGVVSYRNPRIIVVAIEDNDEFIPNGESWRIELASDELSRIRQKRAMEAAKNAKRDRLADIRDVLLGRREPDFRPLEITPSALNESQNEAVAVAMAASDLAIIHGPPGTGKTTTVVEVGSPGTELEFAL